MSKAPIKPRTLAGRKASSRKRGRNDPSPPAQQEEVVEVDADMIVLGFWLGAPDVRVRREKRQAEERAGIERWAQGISGS